MASEPKRILVIDDDLGIRLLLEEALQDEGYDVFLASRGLEGLEMFENNLVQLVILDLRMPGMGGCEVLRILKERKPDIPVILFTAFGEYQQDFATWASNDYLVKGSDLCDLIDCVKRYLH